MICLSLSMTQLFLIYFIGMYIPVLLALIVPGWVLILPFFSCVCRIWLYAVPVVEKAAFYLHLRIVTLLARFVLNFIWAFAQ